MRKPVLFGVVLVGVLAGALVSSPPVQRRQSEGPLLAHMVYFTLKDNSPRSRQQAGWTLAKILSKHEARCFFAAAPLAQLQTNGRQRPGFRRRPAPRLPQPGCQDKYQVASAMRIHQGKQGELEKSPGLRFRGVPEIDHRCAAKHRRASPAACLSGGDIAYA